MPDATAAAVQGGIVELVSVLHRIDRADLAARATAAAARLDRPGTVVCVVGEFKQGKSSLVNGLVGQRACPVDDDLATSAITLVRHGIEPGAVVRRRGDDGETVVDAVPIDQLDDWVSEWGNPGNHKQVERVDIAVDSPLLAQGLVLVDTPGMGGLGAGHAAATLAFLPFADGLIFVSDSSSELVAPEVDFLRQAIELCPLVVFAQTKTDLYPTAGRILELNTEHLLDHEIDISVVATSSVVREAALARRDPRMNERSGVPALVQLIGERIVGPAREHAAERSIADAKAITAMVRSTLEAELVVLDDPAQADAATAAFTRLEQRLEHLRGPGSRWATVVTDGMSDLATGVSHELRSAMRNTLRDMDELVEVLQTGAAWDAMVRDLQSAVAEQVTKAFVTLERGRLAIREQVVTLLDEEDLGLTGQPTFANPFDVGDLWRAPALDAKGKRHGRAVFDSGVMSVRGAQGGMYMFAVLGQFLPRAAGALLATNPVLLGIGGLFGAMGLADDRKRKVQALRQTARSQVRQFIDDVQFEVSNQVTVVVRDLQRSLRDEFTEILAELQRTYADAATRAHEDLQRSTQERAQRRAEVEQIARDLTSIDETLVFVEQA